MRRIVVATLLAGTLYGAPAADAHLISLLGARLRTEKVAQLLDPQAVVGRCRRTNDHTAVCLAGFGVRDLICTADFVWYLPPDAGFMRYRGMRDRECHYP